MAEEEVHIIEDGPDSDGDGLSDEVEFELGLDPNDMDSDDGVPAGDEVVGGMDPNDSDSDDIRVLLFVLLRG